MYFWYRYGWYRHVEARACRQSQGNKDVFLHLKTEYVNKEALISDTLEDQCRACLPIYQKNKSSDPSPTRVIYITVLFQLQE